MRPADICVQSNLVLGYHILLICNEMAVNVLQNKKSFKAMNKNRGEKQQVLANKLQLEKEGKKKR